jgi:hypothetical protein
MVRAQKASLIWRGHKWIISESRSVPGDSEMEDSARENPEDFSLIHQIR